jgi:hypothetical protein
MDPKKKKKKKKKRSGHENLVPLHSICEVLCALSMWCALEVLVGEWWTICMLSAAVFEA